MSPEPNAEAITEEIPDSSDIPAHFHLSRAHTIIGIIPLSIFLIIHLIQAFTITEGADVHNSIRESISTFPFAPWFETIIILIPLLFHAIYGITISIRSRNNPFSYPWTDNWRYALQRYTGYFLAIFLIVHVNSIWMNVRLDPAVTSLWEVSASSILADILRDQSMMVLHYLGVTAVAFHCANGLWNAALKFGLNRRSGIGSYVSIGAIALFLILLWLGYSAIAGFHKIPPGGS